MSHLQYSISTPNLPTKSSSISSLLNNILNAHDFFTVINLPVPIYSKNSIDGFYWPFSISDIKKQFIKIALLIHIDRNSSNKAIEAFELLCNVYRTLSNPKKCYGYCSSFISCQLRSNSDKNNRLVNTNSNNNTDNISFTKMKEEVSNNLKLQNLEQRKEYVIRKFKNYYNLKKHKHNTKKIHTNFNFSDNNLSTALNTPTPSDATDCQSNDNEMDIDDNDEMEIDDNEMDIEDSLINALLDNNNNKTDNINLKNSDYNESNNFINAESLEKLNFTKMSLDNTHLSDQNNLTNDANRNFCTIFFDNADFFCSQSGL